MFEVNDRMLSEWHQVGEQEAIGGLDLVFFVHSKLCATCPHRMADEGQSHVQTAPVVATAAPFFGPSTLRLRRKAVVEEEPRIALKGSQVRMVREDKRCAGKVPRPLVRSFHVSRVQELQVLSGQWVGKVAVGRMEISQLIRGLLQWHGPHLPFNGIDLLTRPHELYARGAKERHGEITHQVDSILGKANVGRKRLDQVLAVVAVIKSAGAVEKSDGSIDGRLRSSVPGDPQMNALESSSLITRNGKAQNTNRRFALQIHRGNSAGRGNVHLSADLLGAGPGSNVTTRFRDQIEHI